MMNTLIHKTIKPFLILSGLFTALIVKVVVFPQSGLESTFQLEYQETYKILIQHWSSMILLVGLFLILSAFIRFLRVPVVLYATAEKIFYAVFYFANRQHDYAGGFALSAMIDTIIVIYFIIYLCVTVTARNDLM